MDCCELDVIDGFAIFSCKALEPLLSTSCPGSEKCPRIPKKTEGRSVEVETKKMHLNDTKHALVSPKVDFSVSALTTSKNKDSVNLKKVATVAPNIKTVPAPEPFRVPAPEPVKPILHNQNVFRQELNTRFLESQNSTVSKPPELHQHLHNHLHQHMHYGASGYHHPYSQSISTFPAISGKWCAAHVKIAMFIQEQKRKEQNSSTGDSQGFRTPNSRPIRSLTPRSINFLNGQANLATPLPRQVTPFPHPAALGISHPAHNFPTLAGSSGADWNRFYSTFSPSTQVHPSHLEPFFQRPVYEPIRSSSPLQMSNFCRF